MNRRCTTLAPVLLLGLLVSPSAWASGLHPHVELELGFNTRSPSGLALTTWSPNIYAATQIDSGLALSAAWGIAALDIESADGSGVQPLNPFIGIHATPSFGKLRFEIGFGATIPLAVAEQPAEQAAFRTARAIRGSWDPWLYRPDTFSLAVPLRVELDAAEALLLAAEGAAFLHVGTRPGSTELWGYQVGGEARLRFDSVHVGARIFAVMAEPEVVQSALEPFVNVELGPLDVFVRMTLNLDRPDGFAFDREGIWGARAGLGYRF